MKQPQSTTAQLSDSKLTYEQILRQSPAQREEKAIQQNVKSNLKSLKASIEKTKDALDTAIDKKDSILDNQSVNWQAYGNALEEIASLELGLKNMKAWRTNLFPNWEKELIED